MNNDTMDTAVQRNINRFRETVAHGTPDFPMKIYKNDFSWYDNRTIDWHWHPEIEIALVISGKVTCYINDIKIDVNEGDGFFINSNTMHKEIPFDENEHPIMTTICFLPDFIGDCGSDLIYRRYIRPIVGDSSLKGLKLSDNIDWQHEMLTIVRNLSAGFDCELWGFELRCRNMISDLWYKLALNLHMEPHTAVVDHKINVNEKRLKKMLSFIHSNFPKELSVDEIAKSANISKSECFRCFRNMIDKKPITYLNEYRLKYAVKLLLTTDMQITEICFACGFNHISYFGKIFRRYYNMSPKEFRNNN